MAKKPQNWFEKNIQDPLKLVTLKIKSHTLMLRVWPSVLVESTKEINQYVSQITNQEFETFFWGYKSSKNFFVRRMMFEFAKEALKRDDYDKNDLNLQDILKRTLKTNPYLFESEEMARLPTQVLKHVIEDQSGAFNEACLRLWHAWYNHKRKVTEPPIQINDSLIPSLLKSQYIELIYMGVVLANPDHTVDPSTYQTLFAQTTQDSKTVLFNQKNWPNVLFKKILNGELKPFDSTNLYHLEKLWSQIRVKSGHQNISLDDYEDFLARSQESVDLPVLSQENLQTALEKDRGDLLNAWKRELVLKIEHDQPTLDLILKISDEHFKENVCCAWADALTERESHLTVQNMFFNNLIEVQRYEIEKNTGWGETQEQIQMAQNQIHQQKEAFYEIFNKVSDEIKVSFIKQYYQNSHWSGLGAVNVEELWGIMFDSPIEELKIEFIKNKPKLSAEEVLKLWESGTDESKKCLIKHHDKTDLGYLAHLSKQHPSEAVSEKLKEVLNEKSPELVRAMLQDQVNKQMNTNGSAQTNHSPTRPQKIRVL